MATILSVLQWAEILQNRNLTSERDLATFQSLYSFSEHKAYASQIGMLLGYSGKAPQAPVNLAIGRYAKRISDSYNIQFSRRSNGQERLWPLFFKGWDEGTKFVWQLRPQLVQALKETGLTGEKEFSEELPLEVVEALFEGMKRTIVVNTYERNSKAREACIRHWLPVCTVCGFDFEKKYGIIGKNFIHVHHLTPIAKIGNVYQVDPINDLRPVCPNCHSMIHQRNPALTIEELKQLIHLCK